MFLSRSVAIGSALLQNLGISNVGLQTWKLPGQLHSSKEHNVEEMGKAHKE